MDRIEKTIHDLYQAIKKKEEGEIPEFNIFLNKSGMGRPPGSFRTLYKKVATIAAITVPIALLLYFVIISVTRPQQEQGNPTTDINRLLPTRSLADPENGANYLWQWKAPTDRLLKDASEPMPISGSYF